MGNSSLRLEKFTQSSTKTTYSLDPFVHENGRSAVYMEDLGFKVVRTDPYPKDDALKINVDDYHNCSVDIIVTNPPFSKFRECLKWLEDSV